MRVLKSSLRITRIDCCVFLHKQETKLSLGFFINFLSRSAVPCPLAHESETNYCMNETLKITLNLTRHGREREFCIHGLSGNIWTTIHWITPNTRRINHHTKHHWDTRYYGLVCIQKLSYTDNWGTWNWWSTAGLTRCFLGPRELPWFIHGFLCHVRCDFQMGFPVGAAEGVEMEEEAKMKRKRARNLRKGLNCIFASSDWPLRVGWWVMMLGGYIKRPNATFPLLGRHMGIIFISYPIHLWL